MNSKVIIAVLFFIVSCRSSDNNYTIDQENNEQQNTNGAPNCPDTIYSDWQSSAYILPYPVNTSYQIGLSQCTSSYHGVGQPDQYAIDFNMPINSTITCSRAGVVIHVEESGFDYSFPNNLIVIDHGDGTFGEYMHLTKDGALVSVGDNVELGTIIGLSGATGLAGYPHLHFVIAINDWHYPYESIPFNYKNTSQNPRSLVQDSTYTALPY